MKPAVIDGVCRLRGAHCPWCLTHPEWRAEVGTPEKCPHGITAETAQPYQPGPPRARPGTELHALLARVGIADTEGCGCGLIAYKMDSWGPDECEKRLPEIVDSMEKEAQKRNWIRFVPFKRIGAEGLVRLAIRRSRKAG